MNLKAQTKYGASFVSDQLSWEDKSIVLSMMGGISDIVSDKLKKSG